MNKDKKYAEIIVESFIPKNLSGLHGKVHIKPIAGQEPFKPDIHVACSKSLSEDYPVGAKFKIKAKITSKEGGKPFVYSHYSWPYNVLESH
ncbi:hypothetical protein [Mangrovimonas sp. DI 80]|uniref:hypothetical protein n=1 Tax=Mangrovimonas sp. DI 80 TaxID=1779330 RepID=UPI000975A5FA|nr:hypothetical protein [Mangrovimonas sp. DI 80]OMP32273.1 hypothetical protein BKM32_04270 [Mangrovimonas sp. DI 80]